MLRLPLDVNWPPLLIIGAGRAPVVGTFNLVADGMGVDVTSLTLLVAGSLGSWTISDNNGTLGNFANPAGNTEDLFSINSTNPITSVTFTEAGGCNGCTIGFALDSQVTDPPAATPLPGTLWMFGPAFLAFMAFRRRYFFRRLIRRRH